MQTTLHELIDRHFGQVSERSATVIIAVSLAYLFRVGSSQELTRVLRSEFGAEVRVIDYRRDLQKGYFLKNVKCWIWRVVHRGIGPTKARKMMSKYQIEPRDFALARIATIHPRLSALLRDLASKYTSHPIDRYEDILLTCVEDAKPMIRGFTLRKLRFLTFSGYMSIDDLITELQYHALYAMMLQYPKVDSQLHLTNVARRAAKNFGLNLIQQQTTQGRAHLRRESDGTFTAIKVSINASDGGYLHEVNQTTDILGNLLNDERPRLDFADRVTVNALIENHKGRKQQLLQLLTGAHHEGFSKWLHEDGYPDNDELMDRCLSTDTVNEYVDLAAEYLAMKPKKTDRFLRELRATL